MLLSILHDMNEISTSIYYFIRLISYYFILLINLYYYLTYDANEYRLIFVCLVILAIWKVSNEHKNNTPIQTTIYKYIEKLHIIYLVIFSYMNIFNKNKSKVDIFNEYYGLIYANTYVLYLYLTESISSY